MSATNVNTVLETLELDSAIIEALPESVLSELIGFIEYDGRLRRHQRDEQGPPHSSPNSREQEKTACA